MQTTSAPASDLEYGKSLRMRGYRTSPDQETTAWPPGIPYIVGNEVCERFSFYGMKALFFVHLTSLYVLAGVVKGTAEDLATSTTHLFNASVYALPMIGAILADRLLGKYRTILFLSLVYCAGHAVLAVAENTLLGMYLGLGLIAIGSGGIKPCVSANVGDQFGKGNWFRVRDFPNLLFQCQPGFVLLDAQHSLHHGALWSPRGVCHSGNPDVCRHADFLDGPQAICARAGETGRPDRSPRYADFCSRCSW